MSVPKSQPSNQSNDNKKKKLCVYLLLNSSKSKVYVGTTNNLKNRINKLNNLYCNNSGSNEQNWIPILVITGFLSIPEAVNFEITLKSISKKRSNEFTRIFFQKKYHKDDDDKVNCNTFPKIILPKIFASRHLLYEYDLYWKSNLMVSNGGNSNNKSNSGREYGLYWGSFISEQQQYRKQFEIVKDFSWCKQNQNRIVRHCKLDLNDFDGDMGSRSRDYASRKNIGIDIVRDIKHLNNGEGLDRNMDRDRDEKIIKSKITINNKSKLKFVSCHLQDSPLY
nr:7025_t:CDS:2 [Entrophospora candida]